jgi:chemotaxis signal transduction protein
MTEHKCEEELDSRILNFFRNQAAKSNVMLTIPEVAKGLKVDRRKIETPLALLSKGKNPKLTEVVKSRTKCYILKDITLFCQKMWKEGREGIE